jgi:hypothetical protein
VSVALAAAPIAAAPLTLGACHPRGGPVPAPDVATVKASQQGRYRATVRPAVVPIPVRRLHAWTLHLETAAGAPVDAATITVDGDMPEHRHGLPTRPRVVRAMGGGDHAVDGLKFSMGGWWRVRFAVRAAAGVDTVVFNLSL